MTGRTLAVSAFTLVAAFAMSALAAGAPSPAGGKAGPVSGAEEFRSQIGLGESAKRCGFCDGRGIKVFTPPDKGQHAGSAMGRHHWDVKSPCPVCGGSGRRRQYRTFVRPKAPPPEGVKPCPACGWSGCVKCRTCRGSGAVDCRARGCQKGWIITESSEKMSGNRRRPPTVTPCPECRGFGKLACPECRGRGGEPCRKCNGEGLDPRSPRP